MPRWWESCCGLHLGNTKAAQWLLPACATDLGPGWGDLSLQMSVAQDPSRWHWHTQKCSLGWMCSFFISSGLCSQCWVSAQLRAEPLPAAGTQPGRSGLCLHLWEGTTRVKKKPFALQPVQQAVFKLQLVICRQSEAPSAQNRRTGSCGCAQEGRAEHPLCSVRTGQDGHWSPPRLAAHTGTQPKPVPASSTARREGGRHSQRVIPVSGAFPCLSRRCAQSICRWLKVKERPSLIWQQLLPWVWAPGHTRTVLGSLQTLPSECWAEQEDTFLPRNQSHCIVSKLLPMTQSFCTFWIPFFLLFHP